MADEETPAAFGGVEAIPTTFIIDRAGMIRDRKLGAEPVESYEQRLLVYLKKGSLSGGGRRRERAERRG
jgi:hypothetical protein